MTTVLPRLFLSYARADDEPFTRRLYECLTKEGYTVWFDRENMPSRALTFLQEIRDAIADMDRLILVCGTNAFTSDYVRAEYEYALKNCIPVMPVLRKCDYKDLPETINKLDAPDFRNDALFDTKFGDLLRQLSDPPAKLGDLHSVPALQTWYIDRTAYLKQLSKTVCADIHTPVVITSKHSPTALHGIPGIGKSTIASMLGRECDIRWAFPDGIFWLELGKTPDAAGLMAVIGVAFGDQRSEYIDVKHATARLSALLSDKAILVILDDAWDHQHVESFRTVIGNRCRIVVTTRQPQIILKLGAQEQRIDILSEEEGLALIATRLGRDLQTINPYEADERLIINLLEGHTLSVTLIALQLVERGENYASNLLKRLQEGKIFENLQLDETDKNFNLERSLYLSYEGLNPDKQRRFRALGVFAPTGTFDTSALQAVWQLPDKSATQDAIFELIRVGLLSKLEERFRLHSLLLAYAKALLIKEGDYDVVAHHHFNHYEQLHGGHNTSNDNEERYPLITLDFENLQIALHWGNKHESKCSCDLSVALVPYMQFNQPYRVWKAILSDAYQTAVAVDYQLGQAKLSMILGGFAEREFNYEKARTFYKHALAIYERNSEQFEYAYMLYVLGNLALEEVDYVEAKATYKRALSLFKKISNEMGQAQVLEGLGKIAAREHNYIGAKVALKRALSLSEQISDRAEQGSVLLQLGDLALVENDYTEAKATYERALSLFEQIPSTFGRVHSIIRLGKLLELKGDYAGAWIAYARALPLLESISDQSGKADILRRLNNLALVMLLSENISDQPRHANILQKPDDLARAENQPMPRIMVKLDDKPWKELDDSFLEELGDSFWMKVFILILTSIGYVWDAISATKRRLSGIFGRK